jgi:hypothetical protein
VRLVVPTLVVALGWGILELTTFRVQSSSIFKRLTFSTMSCKIIEPSSIPSLPPSLQPPSTFALFPGTTNALRHQSRIMYAKLTCDLRFTKADPNNITAHPFTYFVCLPNDSCTITNSAGAKLQLEVPTIGPLASWINKP